MRWMALTPAFLLLTISIATGDPAPATQPARVVVSVKMFGSGEPVAGAKLKWSGDNKLKGSGETDAAGQCVVEDIPAQCRWMDVHVSQAGMVPLRKFWNSDSPHGPQFDFQMEKGTEIGGLIVDESGKPVVGATAVVGVSKKYSDVEQDVDLSWKKIKTGANGHWNLAGVPADAKVGIAAFDLMHLEEEFYNTSEYKARESLFGQTAKLTLPTGTPIEVSVLKPDGTPAEGARVFLGRDRRVANCLPPAKADAQGQVRFGCKPGMSCVLTATLSGYGPAQESVSVQDKPAQVVLKLVPAEARTIDLVDSGGKPVAEATVMISRWRGNESLAVELKSDENGHVVWKDAPADVVKATVYAQNYMGKSDFDWKPGEATKIVLLRPTTLTGRVVDSETGEPIKNYALRAACVWHEGERSVWQTFDWQPTQHAKKEPGKFVMPLDDPAYQYVLRIVADGYLPEDSPSIEPDGNAKTINFKLKKGDSVTGKLLKADDQPLSGAQVYLVDAGDWLSIDNGQLDRSQNSFLHATSGADGAFVLPPQKEDFALIVLSDYGTATLTRDQLPEKHGLIPVSPWAKVRGTIQIGGKPAAKIQISGSSDEIKVSNQDTVAAQRYFFATGADGSFELPRVIPGQLILSRQVPNYSPGRMWYVGVAKIDAKPGESYDLKVGEGARVTGQLLITSGKQWMVRQARIEPKEESHVENWENVEVLADGRFRADGLTPGQYTLHVALHEFPPENECGWGRLVGEYTKEVSITSPNGELNLGDVAADAVASAELKVGDVAPDFVVTSVNGKPIHLADLRGKVVLVDFWAGWCAPCVAELPNLQKIQQENIDNAKFSMIGLSLDEKPEDLQLFLTRMKLDYPQAWVGVDSAPVRAYGATAIPATFLISADGHIVAKDLRGEKLTEAIKAELAK